MKIKKILTLLLGVVLLTSCGIKEGDFKIKEISNFSMGNPSSKSADVSFDVQIENNSGTITITDSEFSLFSANDKYLCDVKLLKEIEITKGETTVRLPLEVKLDGGVLGLIKIVPYLRGDTKDMYIKGSITGKKWFFTVKQEFAKIRISELK